MLQDNSELRRLLTRAILALGGEQDAGALEVIEQTSAVRPGLLPDGDLPSLHDALEALSSRLPDNLMVRNALAEAKWASERRDEALPLFLSVIRDARPTDCLSAPPGAVVADLRGPEMKGMRFQSVDLGTDFIEGEPKDARITARETLMMHWPDVSGKSVLDIGAYSGWFSFEAERRGADRVTANEYYSWMVDYPAMWDWVEREQAAGRSADAYNAPYPALNPRDLPGKALFNRVHDLLGSKVKSAFGLVDDTYIEPHDIVLLLGVLYHHENPLGLLRRAFELTRETLIIETLAVEFPKTSATPAWQMFGPSGWGGWDATTVWAPNEPGLTEALLKVGFRNVEVFYGWDSVAPLPETEAVHCRMWVHAHK